MAHLRSSFEAPRIFGGATDAELEKIAQSGNDGGMISIEHAVKHGLINPVDGNHGEVIDDDTVKHAVSSCHSLYVHFVFMFTIPRVHTYD